MAQITFHILAHSGEDRGRSYCWDYSGHWGRTVEAIDRASKSSASLFTSDGDEYVEDGGYVVQTIDEDEYSALPARLRRRLDAVRVRVRVRGRCK